MVIRLISIIAFLVSIFQTSLYSYELIGVKWANSNIPVKYYINNNGAPINDLLAATAFQTAFNTWESIETSSMYFSYMGTTQSGVWTDSGGSLTTDGKNIIGWEYVQFMFGAGVLGVTFNWFIPGETELLESDIAFDIIMPWSTTGSASSFDLETVAFHEIGHLLGLDHVSNPADPMYYAVSPGEIKRSLSADNIAGITFLYPGSKSGSSTTIIAPAILHKSGPNPFKPTAPSDYTVIPFTLNEPTHVRLDIFNMAGELVKTLVDEYLPAGSYTGLDGYRWYGDNGGPNETGEKVGSGVYIYQLKTNSGVKLDKLMIIR
ncbi:MAG: matrixin family metalloprotease [bacterium]